MLQCCTCIWVVLQIVVPLCVPDLARHPYEKDPERDPNLENYPVVKLHQGTAEVGGAGTMSNGILCALETFLRRARRLNR